MTTTSNAPQVAINDIGSAEDLLAAIDATIKYFNDGDLVEGTVVKVDRDEVLLDIGYKTEGVIPSRELSIKHDVDPDEVVAVGDTVEALVLTKEDKEGRLILSKKRAQYERAWGDIEKIKEEDGVVEGTVIEVVKGGLILDIGLRGFLPASLVEMRRVRDLAPYIGQKLEAKIIELDKNRNNVVLSRRAWLEQTQSEVRTTFLKELQKGQVRSGRLDQAAVLAELLGGEERASTTTLGEGVVLPLEALDDLDTATGSAREHAIDELGDVGASLFGGQRADISCLVCGVADDELLAVTTDPVARLTEHRDGRLGERSLVGDGDTHRSGLRGGSRRRRGSGRWRA